MAGLRGWCILFEEWVRQGNRVNVLNGRMECLLVRMDEDARMMILERATGSSHGLYRGLDFEKGVKYLSDYLRLDVIRWVRE